MKKWNVLEGLEIMFIADEINENTFPQKKLKNPYIIGIFKLNFDDS
jgi:hypothetical protein